MKKMEDPKANAAPALSYGDSSLSVVVDTDEKGRPLTLTVTVEVDLPEDTKPNRLQQDLLSATQIVGQASKYLGDREKFFKGEILSRMQTKGVKVEPGFLTPELVPQNKKDFEWKQFAIDTMVQLLRAKDPELKPAAARDLAKAACNKAYKKAPVKKKNKDGSKVKPSVNVKGVKIND